MIYSYFENLVKSCVFARQHKFDFLKIKEFNKLNEVANNSRNSNAFFCIDNVSDGIIYQNKNGSFFQKRIYTIAIIKKYDAKTKDSFYTSMNLCKSLFQIALSKIVHDKYHSNKNIFPFLDDTIHFKELDKSLLDNFTGVYFLLENNEPYNLEYDAKNFK